MVPSTKRTARSDTTIIPCVKSRRVHTKPHNNNNYATFAPFTPSKFESRQSVVTNIHPTYVFLLPVSELVQSRCHEFPTMKGATVGNCAKPVTPDLNGMLAHTNSTAPCSMSQNQSALIKPSTLHPWGLNYHSVGRHSTVISLIPQKRYCDTTSVVPELDLSFRAARWLRHHVESKFETDYNIHGNKYASQTYTSTQ